VAVALRRRGLVWNGERDPTPLLVPRGRRLERQHVALLRHYAYRLLLRDVLKQRERFTASTLARYATAAVTAGYLAFLSRAHLVRRTTTGYRLQDSRIVSFGGTLEWYVARVLTEEFGCAATHGVRLEGARFGGDYDVLACADGQLLYLETKSAPPRQIDPSQLDAFLDRVDTLRPDLALFLVDTTLRMRDKLVPFLQRALRGRSPVRRATRIEREVWRLRPGLYVLNADPDLPRALGTALAAHLRARGVAIPPRRRASVTRSA
jgi:hypothetical protein